MLDERKATRKLLLQDENLDALVPVYLHVASNEVVNIELDYELLLPDGVELIGVTATVEDMPKQEDVTSTVLISGIVDVDTNSRAIFGIVSLQSFTQGRRYGVDVLAELSNGERLAVYLELLADKGNRNTQLFSE